MWVWSLTLSHFLSHLLSSDDTAAKSQSVAFEFDSSDYKKYITLISKTSSSKYYVRVTDCGKEKKNQSSHRFEEVVIRKFNTKTDTLIQRPICDTSLRQTFSSKVIRRVVTLGIHHTPEDDPKPQTVRAAQTGFDVLPKWKAGQMLKVKSMGQLLRTTVKPLP